MSEADELRAALAAADKAIERLTDQREELAQRLEACRERCKELEGVVARASIEHVIEWMREER